MVEQLEECKHFFGEDVSKLVTSLATKEFFKAREDEKNLIKKKVESFHLVEKKVLFFYEKVQT